MAGPDQPDHSNELTGLHREIIRAAANTHLAGTTPTFGLSDMLDYVPAWAGWKAGKDTHIFNFKDNWVSHYKDVLLDAAAKNDIPAEVLAGVGHIEAGGKPDISKEALYWTRKLYPLADLLGTSVEPAKAGPQ